MTKSSYRNAPLRPAWLPCAAILALVVMHACGDGSTEPPPPDPPRPTTVTVSPATARLTALGATVQLSAEVRDQNGSVMAGATVAWSSGDATVATVDGSGLVTAASNGTATITATSGSASGSAEVTVAQEVSAVTVTPAGDTVVVGDTLRIEAKAADANGHPVTVADFDWASSDTLVATVDDVGLVTGIGAGEAEVTATAAGVMGRTTLTVVAPAPTAVAVIPDSVALTALGQTAQLTGEVRDQIGRVMEDVRVSWSSADTTVATVDSAGLVAAIGGGTTSITATAGEVAATAAVTVMQAAGSVTVSPQADTLVLGDTLRLVAEAFDENRHAIAGAEFTWSSSNRSVATVDASGLVTGLAEGMATITAMAGAASGTSEITVENPDRAALVALYESTNGPNWVDNTNWLTDAPLAKWYGVDTDASGRVVGLTLAGHWDNDAREWVRHGLEGPIPTELGNLAGLTTFDLGSNELTGPIPPELGSLSSLRTISLSRNDLAGPIPSELGGLADLTRLDLSYNALSGPIPPELGNLAQLTRLVLNDNALTGAIPPELGRLTQLTYLHLGTRSLRNRNVLTGPIPAELGGLTNLEVLNLRYSDLTGEIPAELGNLSRLRELGLNGNRLEGEIPAELGKVEGLVRLILSQNNLYGPIPPELGNLRELTFLDLYSNTLTGTIPPELGNLNQLSWLRLHGNSLTGPLPQSSADLAAMNHLTFDQNDGLCAPGVARFVTWLDGLDNFSGAYCNEADAAVLEALFETAGGSAWTNAEGWLGGPALAAWHGVGTDSLGLVTTLDLSRNELAGTLPGGLGDLAALTALHVDGNPDLSGRLPLSMALAALAMEALHYSGTELCTPVGPAFREWLRGIPSHRGTGNECAPVPDREHLAALFEATDGPNWTTRRGWLTDAPVHTWHGVAVDGEGRVVALVLPGNGLSGKISTELGYLDHLEQLDLSGNQLSGLIPPQLGYLDNLKRLDLSRNQLSGAIPSQVGYLPDLEQLDLSHNRLVTAIPPEFGNLSSLRFLSFAGNGMSGTIPPELGNLRKLESFEVFGCVGLRGSIPPEIGDMTSLRRLRLQGSGLSGRIPPELGKLVNLETLTLTRGKVTGRIPPELGNLASLQMLDVSRTELSGAVPPELGRLSNLRVLRAAEADLEGGLPPELGALARLEELDFTRNALSGSIPPEFGNLANLRELRLGLNDLTGSIPSEFGTLSSLRQLYVNGNRAMEGQLPASLGELSALGTLHAGGTDLCAPPELRTWLGSIPSRRVALCETGSVAAYLTQAVQSTRFPVPLVAGEEALLRVFVTAARANEERIPPVRASFYVGGTLAHVAEIPGQPGPIPTEIDEGSLDQSANALIPAEVVRPGLEMVVEVDPDSTMDTDPVVTMRIPETGLAAVDVRSMPVLDLTLIPLIWTHSPDSSVIATVAAMSANAQSHEMLSNTRTLLPVGDLNVAAHEPVLTSAGSKSPYLTVYPWGAWLGITEAIRVMEGGTGHYMSVLSVPSGSAGGSAKLGGRVSFSDLNPGTIAHELGHNLSLRHAPCGGASGLDAGYPHAAGTIGDWGYDFRNGGRLVTPNSYDLMSYCEPDWVGSYHFEKALRFRLTDEGTVGAAVAGPARSLLLWGGADSTGTPYLEPAFVVGAPAALPVSAGDHRITGRTAEGTELFSLNFAMPETADGDGGSSFVFAIPVRPEWEDNLASITLSGPGGAVTLDGDSDRPMAILRNPRSGQVRGFLRDPPAATQAAADGRVGGTSDVEVLFSRGIPDAAAWRR